MIPIKIKSAKAYAKNHQASIMNYMRIAHKKKLHNIDKWLNQKLNIKFEEILVMNPKELAKVRTQLDLSRLKYPQSIKDLIKLYNNFATESKTPFRNGQRKYSAYTFVQQTGVSVCPYCNRNYVINVPGEYRRTSELDHVFPKEKYPLFSLSFFNLVPACKICNQIKHNKPGDYYNPYDTSIRKFPEFIIDIKGASFLDDKSLITIKLNYDRTFKHTIENLFIEKLYSEHVDIIQDIVKKKYIYNNIYVGQLKKALTNIQTAHGAIIRDEQEFANLFLNSFLDSQDFHKRPFSKLTSDVWAQIIQDSKF